MSPGALITRTISTSLSKKKSTNHQHQHHHNGGKSKSKASSHKAPSSPLTPPKVKAPLAPPAWQLHRKMITTVALLRTLPQRIMCWILVPKGMVVLMIQSFQD
uniref:Uncharacterized protein n=1 Tax=Helianthus annuus TaxID=4232 RepID=A0A251V7F4_HELAN